MRLGDEVARGRQTKDPLVAATADIVEVVEGDKGTPEEVNSAGRGVDTGNSEEGTGNREGDRGNRKGRTSGAHKVGRKGIREEGKGKAAIGVIR